MHKSIEPLRDTSFAWLDELISAGLSTLHRQQGVMYIIERNDQLKDLLSASYQLNADAQKNILELLLEQNAKHPESMLWVRHTGKIVAAHARVTTLPDAVWIDHDISTLPQWKQDAIFITSKTDAIVLYLNPSNRLCECIIQGNVISDLVAHHALLLIKRHMTQTLLPQESHDQSTIKNKNTYSQQQR